MQLSAQWNLLGQFIIRLCPRHDGEPCDELFWAVEGGIIVDNISEDSNSKISSFTYIQFPEA